MDLMDYRGEVVAGVGALASDTFAAQARNSPVVNARNRRCNKRDLNGIWFLGMRRRLVALSETSCLFRQKQILRFAQDDKGELRMTGEPKLLAVHNDRESWYTRPGGLGPITPLAERAGAPAIEVELIRHAANVVTQACRQ